MPETYYREALKLGQRDYRACVAAGRSPCLPVLDDFVSPERSAKGTELGIVQIPMERIVGTGPGRGDGVFRQVGSALQRPHDRWHP